MISGGCPSSKQDLPNTQTHNDSDEVANLEGPTQSNRVSTYMREDCEGGSNITANIRA